MSWSLVLVLSTGRPRLRALRCVSSSNRCEKARWGDVFLDWCGSERGGAGILHRREYRRFASG